MSSAASNIGPVPRGTPFLIGLPNQISDPWAMLLEKLRTRRTAAPSGTGALLDEVTLASDSSITGPGAPASDGDFLIEAITQDGTGGWEITWGGDFMPLSPTTVALSPNAVTIFPFVGIGGVWWPFSNGIFLEP